MPLEVLFHPLAEADLNSLYDYIAADNPERALRQIYRIKERALGLALMPMKGRARSDLGENVRALTFDRRAIIAYRIEATAILILRIFYAGQNLEPIKDA